MDGFVSSHNSAQGTATGQFTMSYLDRTDIPFHYALAENFTICDGYHCSLLGPTWPNRLYLMSAWIDPAGVQGGPIISNQHNTPYQWKSYPEALTQAGVSWKVYQETDNYGCNVLEYFNSFQTAPVSSPLYQNGLRSYQEGQFEWDAIHDRLPFVSWLIPTSYQSEHCSLGSRSRTSRRGGGRRSATYPRLWATTPAGSSRGCRTPSRRSPRPSTR
jgi:phospholipase C